MDKGQINQKAIYNYSLAFKQKVISEIENGTLTMNQAKLKYGIKGAATISNWIKKFGKNHLLCKKIRIEMPDEQAQLKQLQARIRELENVVVQTQIDKLAVENLFSLACQDLQTTPETYKKKLDSVRGTNDKNKTTS